MNVSSPAGIASAWTATRADAKEQAVQFAALKSQAQADQALAEMVETAVETPPPSPPAPPGQGRYVDVRA